ncbi:uncharacterized protein [Palaemon carinicauda]|uniref:uncharacterized protein n=1 Tax=Palaemon carinicauda TaxID=392227 RepID=UPI0035B5F91B
MMKTSSFYGNHSKEASDTITDINEDNSEESDTSSSSNTEDLDTSISSDSSTSSSSSDDEIRTTVQSDNDESQEDEDDPSQDDDDDVATSVTDSWGSVSPAERSFIFTGTEELLYRPNPSGPNNSVLPLDLYKLFVSEDYISEIVQETNIYASQISQSRTLSRRSRMKAWVPTDSDEMKKFIGIILCMGLV